MAVYKDVEGLLLTFPATPLSFAERDNWFYERGFLDFRDKLAALPNAEIEQKHSIRFADKDHVWIDGKQYISLRRFGEAIHEAYTERKKSEEESEEEE